MIINNDYPAPRAGNDHCFSTFSRTRLADKIGHDLRGVYDEMTVTSQPDYLVELASRIDERRRSGGFDD